MIANRLPVLVEIAVLTLLPGAVLAQNTGATRASSSDIPAADALETDSTPQAQARPSEATSSKTLGPGTKDPIERRIENTMHGLAAPGSLMGGDVSSASGDAGEKIDASRTGGTGGAVPELHVVQKGDTLWSLCSKYFGDPWRWPRLWAANPAITNPHWIFPGDVIKLGESSGPAAASVPSTAPVAAPRTGLLSVNRVGASDSNALMLRELGFIEAKDLDQAATITGSREEKIMLATGDQAYLRYPEKAPVRAGERYSVFTTDTDNPVVDTTTGKTYGYLVKIQGDLIVNQIAENDIARGTLVDTVVPIERGSRVSAQVRQFRRIEPRPSDVTLQARVIATFEPNMLLYSGHFVVLNCGSRDGVRVGNRTFVIRRGDGYRRVLESWEKHDPNAPKEVVGEIWVVDVRDTASVAWIARTTKELKVGEIVEMRKGH